MEINRAYLFLLLIVFAVDQSVASTEGRLLLANDYDTLGRKSFPAGFIFGTASSSYQYEGAAYEGGRAPSIWDTYTKEYPEKVKDRGNGSFAIDSYHRYKEDVSIMKGVGFDAYRFSISWSRVLPRGTVSGGINEEGIAYYNNLINELLSNGIQPFVTLFHWDLPQELEDAYGGFLSSQIIDDFRDYAEVCYREFGDRVKNWITMNEPVTFASLGYGSGAFAPGRCSKWMSPSCYHGDSATEPYLVSHHQLLAHAAAVQLYRAMYQAIQGGQIGITLNSPWIIPLSQSNEDYSAASRAIAFMYNWIMEPLNYGSYPSEMVDLVGGRLPRFSVDESEIIKGSFDFIGLNYYTSNYAANAPCETQSPSYFTDSCASITNEKSGISIGPKLEIPKEEINIVEKSLEKLEIKLTHLTIGNCKAASDWLYIYPEGIQDLLLYTKNKFNDPVIYIENGVDDFNNDSISLEDDTRIDYYNRHLAYVQSAITKGVNVKGYFAWSLMDNFEWVDGYTVRFGIIYVDYKDGLKRYPKKSAKWFKTFLHET